MKRRERQRVRLEVRGAVQGVGFRPFVYRLADELGLGGWVANDSRGVTLEAEGDGEAVAAFLDRFPVEVPPRAVVHGIERCWLDAVAQTRFVIRDSDAGGEKSAVLLPDVATCIDCLREIFDPRDRRYLYPFTNCTNCGPRFSIIEGLPYDRPRTTMAGFEMCPACAAEYEDPRDRRFHAQPNACPRCGPRLWLEGAAEGRVEGHREALAAAAAAIAAGLVVAVRGLGGFHLVVDASSETAVARLRRLKGRDEKPFAVMVRDLEQARHLTVVDDDAERVLTDPAAPIVLAPRRDGAEVAVAVAPGLPDLGVMLAYTPLHHLLLAAVGRPVVATSGNLADEPIATGNDEARRRLAGVADLFLLHDRPIARRVDDSVVRPLAGATTPIRRSRGLAPLPVLLPRPVPGVLAVGAHQKATVALALDRRVFLSQHLGDLDTPRARAAFESTISDLLALYEARPRLVAHDLHPDFPSTRWAEDAVAEGGALAGAVRVPVQHHHAHLAACLAEHGHPGRALGVVWDGTGLGDDGTLWGGEFLLGDAGGYERVAALAPFLLPGGEKAVREPRRLALSLLWEVYGDQAWEHLPFNPFEDLERRLLDRMLATGLHSPRSTSAGRLFDGVAALAGVRQLAAYEGQAAIELEHAAATVGDVGGPGAYRFDLVDDGHRPPMHLDWRPLVAAAADDARRGVAAGEIAARFHATLADAVLRVARRVGEATVALTGGCFQNRRLTELCHRALERDGFEVLLHRQVPPNDGGLALGQVAVAAARAAAATAATNGANGTNGQGKEAPHVPRRTG